ncbi:hypothetical protein [Mucilaginibacter jinjuensis]|uniref:Uncharacterized protein n=1 Tax=Mucilaginibacter jinjuensis TaxID=1176721 RepID=A0ABY7TCX2_9SPHI|nr:hypothetical protein [Mucilaginibacter jinjuensis]WCT14360.1 hypothetical protein PQO05_10490 [Mucilaginibacter jinjuensis]
MMIHCTLDKIIRSEAAKTVVLSSDVKIQLHQMIDQKNSGQ